MMRMVETQAGLLGNLHYAFAMAEDSMLYWLARAAKQLREAAGRKQVHVAAALSIDQSSIYRFEQNGDDPHRLAWPRSADGADGVIRAYADDLEIKDPRTIWGLALTMWRQKQDRPDLVDEILRGGPVADELAGPVEELARAGGRPQRGSGRTHGESRRRAAG
jgi:hypothetical protein